MLQLHVINVIRNYTLYTLYVQLWRRKYCSAVVRHDTAHIFFSEIYKCCFFIPFLISTRSGVFQEKDALSVLNLILLSSNWIKTYDWNTTLCKTLPYCRRVFVPSLSAGGCCCCIRSCPGRTERRSPRCWPPWTPEGLATASPLGAALGVGAGLNRKRAWRV